MEGRRWAFAVGLLLVAWALRLCLLQEVPPGWRDDELINIHALSNQLLQGEFPIYYLGASGHEPLYHHLHAGVHAILGFNVLSGHILSVAFGLLSVALTYSLVRRLFPDEVAVAGVAALTLATSFWSLMYSRTGIRHISLPPFFVATVYVLWHRLDAEELSTGSWLLLGFLLGASLYTYTASRVLPVLLIVFVAYLGLFHGDRMEGRWRGLALAFLVAALLAAPLGVAIARGRSSRAIEGIGADARVTKLATPLRALKNGEVAPLLISVVKTLGMFHASGDPEWLYNIPDRPVFNPLGGVLLWFGVALCLYRWREPRYFFLLPCLGLGLSPAFISTPPASLGHTIAAQPAAYILPALALVEIRRWVWARQASQVEGVPVQARFLGFAVTLILASFVLSSVVRDIRDYFTVWPERGMVRFLYRADHREAAEYLHAHPEITDVAIGSGLVGPWDRIALDVDVGRDRVAPRLFNPERALVWSGGDEPAFVLLTSWPDPSRPIQEFLEPGRRVSSHLELHTPSFVGGSQSIVSGTTFANGLALAEARWLEDRPLAPGQVGDLLTVWDVVEPLDLPEEPVVAQPPPPDTYSGPRLAVFVHLTDAEGRVLDTDDGLWVDPLTLQPGDRFVQIHRLSAPAASTAERHALELGLYDPKTNQRWDSRGSEGELPADSVHVPIGEQQ
ncbi:MAG: glycosyltransferase family 39 protein [Anaerolineae bacterium]|jgi:4-amino-4-deoxy-L-arabinose transferase-like glycosyltransferase